MATTIPTNLSTKAKDPQENSLTEELKKIQIHEMETVSNETTVIKWLKPFYNIS